jgi:MFS superfamily sulfate permease-like transporter
LASTAYACIEAAISLIRWPDHFPCRTQECRAWFTFASARSCKHSIIVRGDLLSGLVVALALIPEAIAFSIIAGVDPKVGLYASSRLR